MPQRADRDRLFLTASLLLVSFALHLPIAYWVWRSTWGSPLPEPSEYLVVNLEPPPPEDPLEPEPEPEEDVSGQIVKLAPPFEERRPDEAKFLAEHDHTVEKEERSKLWEVLPKVLSPVWSQERRYQQEELFDLNVERPSTGAQAGAVPFPYSALGQSAERLSMHALTNKQGSADPVQASHSTQSMAGSPSNDVLDVPEGNAVLLNAREYAYAQYWNRVSDMVNFYAQQTLDNADPESPYTKRRYKMRLHAMIKSDGHLGGVRLVESCGMKAFDDALVQAWQLAAPFPDPPEGLLEEDGFAHARAWDFTIMIRPGGLPMGGYDFRSDERFPGLQTGDPMMKMR